MWLAAHAELAGELVVHAREDLDQRALAGPVLTGEDVYFAWEHVEIDPVQDLYRPERLADPAHDHYRIGRGSRLRGWCSRDVSHDTSSIERMLTAC